MAGVDRELLAVYLRNRINDEHLSIRKAAEQIGCSAATLSRLMAGEDGDYVPDTATVTAAATWLGMELSDFEAAKRPLQSSLAEVEVHLHALPNITEADAKAMMAAVRAWYETKQLSGNSE